MSMEEPTHLSPKEEAEILNTVSRLRGEYDIDGVDKHWSSVRRLVPLTRKFSKTNNSRVASATSESLVQVDGSVDFWKGPETKHDSGQDDADWKEIYPIGDCQIDLMGIIVTVIVTILVSALLIPVIVALLAFSVTLVSITVTIVRVLQFFGFWWSFFKHACVWEAINGLRKKSSNFK
jgi:hypothetical protein